MEKYNIEQVQENYSFNYFIVEESNIIKYDLRGLEINVFSIILKKLDLLENKFIVSPNYISKILRENVDAIDEIIKRFLNQKKIFGNYQIKDGKKTYYLYLKNENKTNQLKKEKKSDVSKYLYIMKSDHKTHSYKIGITQDLSTRIKTLSRNKDIPNMKVYLATNKSISLTFAANKFIKYLKKTSNN